MSPFKIKFFISHTYFQSSIHTIGYFTLESNFFLFFNRVFFKNHYSKINFFLNNGHQQGLAHKKVTIIELQREEEREKIARSFGIKIFGR